MDKIQTAYGIRETEAIPYPERVQLLSDMCEALSIRGKNRKEFFNKLRKLVDEYSADDVGFGKELRSPYKNINKLGLHSFYTLITEQRNGTKVS
jgi:hypothetical protein